METPHGRRKTVLKQMGQQALTHPPKFGAIPPWEKEKFFQSTSSPKKDMGDKDRTGRVCENALAARKPSP